MGYEVWRCYGGVVTSSFVGSGVGGSAPRRGSVRGFSRRSGSRLSRYLRSCVADYRTLVTLTYPGEQRSWLNFKRDLRVFLARCARRSRGPDLARPWSACWFLEFQRRGAPHFHIFLTHDIPKDWCSDAWFDVVNSGDEKHRRAGTRCERLRSGRNGTIGYARKYATKREQKQVPDLFAASGVGRWWGVVGCREIVDAATRISASELCDPNVRDRRHELLMALDCAVGARNARYFHGEFSEAWCFTNRATEEEAERAFFALRESVINASRMSLQAAPLQAASLHPEGRGSRHVRNDWERRNARGDRSRSRSA